GGVAGGMDELRVLAYLEKLGVLDPLSGAQPGGFTGSPASETGDGPGGASGEGPEGGPGDAPGGGAGAVPGMVPCGFAGRVNMTLTLATLLGLAERPGVTPRIGPIDPALVRDLAAAAARSSATT